MDARSEELFEDRSNVKNIQPSLKIKVGQKGRTFYFKRNNNVHIRTR
jgi:hypothetical protein